MEEIAAQGEIDEQTKKLTVNGREIGFVYYRTGYQADHYQKTNDADEWDE